MSTSTIGVGGDVTVVVPPMLEPFTRVSIVDQPATGDVRVVASIAIAFPTGTVVADISATVPVGPSGSDASITLSVPLPIPGLVA